MRKSWRIQEAQEARDKLSEVVEKAIEKGPQILTRQGVEVAVVLSFPEFLQLSEESLSPLTELEGRDPQPNAEIDRLYDQIWNLISEKKDGPELPAAVAPLRKQLRELQEKEADTLEQRALGRLHFDPDEWQQFLERSRRLLAER